jgi:hypothetical protein
MSFSLTTAYPWWLALICLLAGLGYAFILYYKNQNNGFSRSINIFLFGVRSLTVSLIAFLLLSPLLKSVMRHSEKPVIVIAADNSESIVIGKDSAFYRQEFPGVINEFAQDLQSRFDVVTYSFSGSVESGVRAGYRGKETDISNVFNEVRNRYSNRNLAALILASDGISTKGTDPLYAAENVPYSVYSIVLGDTAQYRDLVVARVRYNQIAYLGNNFPIEISVLGHKCSGEKSRLIITSGDKELYAQELTFSGDEVSKTISTELAASVPGVQRYRISIAQVSGEISKTNNYRDIFIEVIDSRQKILILSASPHPDIAAIKSAIEINRNYMVEHSLLGDFNGNLKEYSLVIMHQVPSIQDAAVAILSGIREQKIPVLYILGSSSNLTAFNALQAGLSITPSASSSSSAYPVLNKNFSQFDIADDISSIIPEFPPLNVPFGQYKTGASADPLIFQKIGSIQTMMPLILFNQGLENRSAVITGEGLWRWRLSNYLKTGDHKAFDQFLGKMVQYLALKADKSQFRVIMNNYFTENEIVEIDAELYNDSYELVNDPEVSMIISDNEGRNFPFSFSRTTNSFYLNAGSFMPGEYSWRASTSYGGRNFQKNGSFVVVAFNEETMVTVANANLLYSLAKQHNGEMYYPSGIQNLKNSLNSREDLKTVTYARKKYTDLVNLFWVMALIVSLLSVEWFIRKRSGGY